MFRDLPALALALALALSWCSLAQAQDDAPPEYQGLVDAAVAEFSAGRWPEARALFQRAHASHPNARTLRGIGMSSFEMRDYPEAVRALEAALASEVRALTAEQRTQVEGLLVRARALVGRFRMPPAPAGSRLYVDGAGASAGDAWPEEEGSLVLSVGRHDVSVRAEGRSAHAQIDVRGGEDADLDIDLSELLPPSRARVEADPDVPPPRTRVVPGREPADDTPAWMLTGIAGGVAAVGVVIFAIGYADVVAVESTPMGARLPLDANERAPILTGIGGTLIGVGVGAAVIGLFWALLNDGGDVRDDRAALGVDVGAGSLTLHGSF